jgi:protease IV
VGTTPLSGQLRIDRPLGEEAKSLLQSQISRGYEEFLGRVSAGRKMTRDQVDAIAQGHVWAGTDAKRLGLVDHLGSFDDAVKAAARRAKLTDYDIEFIEPEMSWAQALVVNAKMDGARALYKVFGPDRESQALAQMASQLDPLRREVERLSRFSVRNRLYAYCFCSAE